MEADLRALVSRTVVGVSGDKGELALLFEHGTRLSVRQPYRLCCPGQVPGQVPGLIAGWRLVGISAGTAEIAFDFSGGARLQVPIQDEQETRWAALDLTPRQGRLDISPCSLPQAA